MNQQHVLLGAALGALTAGLSHEIRNPLNSASLQLAVLERRLKKLSDEDAQAPLLETLGLVRDELRRLDRLMDEFLGFAAPAPIAPELVSLQPVLDRVVALLAADADRRGLGLRVSCDDQSVVLGDEHQLHRVFTNLCLNALDATPQGGGVLISCSHLNGQLVVHVDDDGPAMSEEDHRKIFEPFFNTRTTESELAFPINNAIITRHGGAIAVSASPRGGSRVSVTLPHAKTSQAATAAAGARRTLRIP